MKFADTLEESGMELAQAKTLSKAMQTIVMDSGHHLATQHDLTEIRSEIVSFRAECSTAIHAVNVEVQSINSHMKMIKWAMGLMIGIGMALVFEYIFSH
ncbi:hypothetical protein ICV01_04290 [Polynucleobacter sp. MWH-Spelu-300-X4]|uniref:hypothetical protein n=1 Tax=Polynucleobacter sp. MWH-Spelu-300-X4 TaxID=2689109 RepID=UPI001BFE826C|nr:hypothetical protein [Polynucleobacter sp. MWH-Spelu-300-X4]QWD80531.1 hypothetical protein ICV01_04290 [Polynucleobacter sp. MWH-Spelu-300-X4]